MELWFTMENYGTMEKTIWYLHGQNYGTILRTMELWCTKKKKNIVDYDKTKKLWFIMVKTMVIYQNNFLNKFIALK